MIDKPVTKLEIVPTTPQDALDIETLWVDSALGDGLTDTGWHSIPVDKPKDFFRVHPDPDYGAVPKSTPTRPKARSNRVLHSGTRDAGTVAGSSTLRSVTCIYRDGSPRLWPIMFPREGEKDNTAWSSARSAARTAIDKWVKLVWAGRSYQTRDALPGYAPDPDWKKLPAFNELVKAAFGPHGVIQDTTHPIYRELMGAPATSQRR